MGNIVEEPTDEEKRKILKAEEYESGLQGYKQRRGEIDTYLPFQIYSKQQLLEIQLSVIPLSLFNTQENSTLKYVYL